MLKNIAAQINPGINQICQVKSNNSSPFPVSVHTKRHYFYSMCGVITPARAREIREELLHEAIAPLRKQIITWRCTRPLSPEPIFFD